MVSDPLDVTSGDGAQMQTSLSLKKLISENKEAWLQDLNQTHEVELMIESSCHKSYFKSQDDVDYFPLLYSTNPLFFFLK